MYAKEVLALSATDPRAIGSHKLRDSINAKFSVFNEPFELLARPNRSEPSLRFAPILFLALFVR